MATLGKIYASGAVVSLLSMFPIGWLCDRFSPLRVALCALMVYTVLQLLAYFLVKGVMSVLIYNLSVALPYVGFLGLGEPACRMKLFPKEKFGQYYSASNVFNVGFLIPGNFLVGWFMDFLHSNYRMAYLWSGAFYALAIYPMCLVYRDWKKFGGLHHYTPPLPETAS
jgi:MFS family permease